MIKYKDIQSTDWFYEAQKKYMKAKVEKKYICPVCLKRLTKKHEGWACRNNCYAGFKLGQGWVYLDGKKKNSYQFFKDQYDFNIERFENRKKWLRLKSEVLNEKGRECEICSDDFELHVHHIISRSENPSLTFDKQNLMVLCKKCHLEIHKEDKYRFGGRNEK